MSWGRTLSTHRGSGSRVLPSARPRRVTTLLLSFSRCLWMSSDTTRGQSSWSRPMDRTHTSTFSSYTSYFNEDTSVHYKQTTPFHVMLPETARAGKPTCRHTYTHQPTSEMTTGRCSMGYPGTSPSRSWCLNPWWAILLTPLFSTHSSLVFHGGDVFTDAKTVGMLSTALKAPEISSDLFQKNVHVRWSMNGKPRRFLLKMWVPACQLTALFIR